MQSMTKSIVAGIVAGALSAGAVGFVQAEVYHHPAQDLRHFPHMHAAWDSLQSARNELQNADPIFQGHRDKALEHVDAALHEVRQGFIDHGEQP